MTLVAFEAGEFGRSHDVDDLVLRLSMARGLDEIMAEVRQSARALIGADGVTFVLREGELCHYADEDAISPLWKGQRFPASTCISGWAMRNRQVVVIEDIFADDRIPHSAYRPTFVKSLAMAPVRRDDPVAAIGAYWATRQMPAAWQVDALTRIANSAAVAMANVALYEKLRQSEAEAERAKDAIVFAMASLAETRDRDTGNHVRRTQHYVRALAHAAQPHFPDELTDETAELLFKAAPLHDVGKIGIPDRILLKPGKLTRTEMAVMRTHAAIGARAIERAEQYLGTSRFLELAREIAFTHHEKWDGSGYPRGLAGTDIPLSGRIVAIADVYDALLSKRVYKEPMPADEAMAIMISERGRHFDPTLIDLFAGLEPLLHEITRSFAD